MHYRKLFTIIALAAFCGNAALADDSNTADQQVAHDPYAKFKIISPPEVNLSTEELQKAAEGGDSKAQGELARSYFNGTNGLAVNYEKAVFWAQKAADQGDANGKNILGVCYLHGIALPQDAGKAVELFRAAARQGLERAQINLAMMVISETNASSEELNEVEKMLLCAVTKEGLCQPEAAYWLGRLYLDKAMEEKNIESQEDLSKKSVAFLKSAANSGHVLAQTTLGFCFSRGIGVKKDNREAVRWYRAAAEQGNPLAQTKLAIAYRVGLGVGEKDDGEAVRWFLKAAEQGDATAQYFLACAYEAGDGVAQNEEEAMKWLRKAAKQGDEAAKKKLREKALKNLKK